MLSEDRRKQLDGIVQQMATNKESDSNVQFVVDDFKKKYANEPVAPGTVVAQPKKSVLDTVEKIGSVVPNLALGAAKGLGSTIAGASSLGEKLLLRPIDKLMGHDTSGPTEGEQIQKELLQPTNTSQKIGFGAEQVAEFFAPGGAAGKLGKATETLTGASKTAKFLSGGVKLATEGSIGSGINAIQKGDTQHLALNAILFGGLSGASSALGKAGEAVTKKLPSKLVNTAIKPTLDESRKAIKYGGETLGDQLLKRGVAGSDQKLLDTAIENINKSENELQSILGTSKETIKRGELGKYLDNLITTQQSTPGLGAEVEKVRGILQEFPEEVPIQKANEIKRNIYNALRDVAYKINPSLSTNKEAMKALANGIKTEIESKTAATAGADVVKNINKDLSVYGKLQDRVVDKLARSERNNILGLGDLVTMGAGTGAAGLPGGIASYITKKVVGSTAFKTNAAKVLNNLGTMLDKLPTDAAGNISKNALFKAIQSLNN